MDKKPFGLIHFNVTEAKTEHTLKSFTLLNNLIFKEKTYQKSP